MTKVAKKTPKKSKRKIEEPQEEQGYTPKDMARAQRLLHAVTEALPQIDEILKTTNSWSAGREAPPLLKLSASWRDAVDPKTFQQFEKLIDFLRDAVFGVDCDHDSAVQFVLRDCGREEDFLPTCRVPRVKDHASVAKRFEQLELAKHNLQCIQSGVEHMERSFERSLKEIIKADDLRGKAKNCETCAGKGWIETDHATWHALDYGAKCRTRDIGCDFSAKPENKFYKIFRLFCECQEESEDEEDGGDGN